MEFILNPARSTWPDLCRRNIPADDPAVDEAVRTIADRVAREGDAALLDFARRFDGVELTDLLMSPAEMAEGVARVAPEVKAAIDAAAANIEAFHRAQKSREVEVETAPGVRCVQRAVAIERVGLYIPGGRAPLFSTVLMLGIPALIAGCREAILCTPCSRERGVAPEIIYAAEKCGIDKIYKVGGAQAIAAMALGTESIPRVFKIFGPGNRYVTKAKQLLSSVVAIDMPAGPSEVMVLADSTADARFVAADMLSQAEHGPDSQAILVTDSEETGRRVAAEVDRQKALLTRAESVESSLSKSRIVVLGSRQEILDFSNAYAPEHLIVSLSDAWKFADGITDAGSVFIGNYSPESAGDYASGSNHTLPTGGWATSFSGVNLDSFIKKITFQELTPDGLRGLAPTIVTMADAEGLDAHAAAVKIRISR